MPENPIRRDFLGRMAGLGLAGTALGANAAAQSAPASATEFHLPEYACAQTYRSLNQSSFDRTGGNADRWVIEPGETKEVFAEQADLLIDFYHVSEYLAAAAERCRPKAPDAWRRTQQKRLKCGAIQKILLAMEPFAEPETVIDADAPVRSAIRYISNRLACLDYPRAIALQLPIGSGLIESSHKHILHARLKQPGTAWLAPHADAIAQLRVLRANHHWDSLWSSQQAA